MRIGEIMTREVRTVGPGQSADDAYQSMRLHGIRHLVVMDGRRVVGIVSERDLGGGRGGAVRAGRTVEELMARHVATAAPETTIRQAANLLRGRTIGCLPVVDDSKLVGIVTVTDLLELVGEVTRKASTDARWKPVRRMGRWPRNVETRRAKS
ncbi:CBS domain-containing protein [Anaeromyxobacter terrae]|uniref:CBS domain-containing protein n=1 Tax=Anaeromyxobacter terrae TaxID=2925406 RepID=UPI001F5A54A3|nr:CBS domain-containing protein [Anaeromyxobacter sp. SG22]